MEFHQGIGYEKACRLSNTCHTDVAPALSLPLLPLCFGASDSAEDPSQLGDREEFIDQASAIAELLNDCDISYLKLKRETRNASEGLGEYSRLYSEVLKYNPQAFDCSCPGPLQERHLHNQIPDIRKPIEQYSTIDGHTQNDYGVTVGEQPDQMTVHDPAASSASRKLKFKKKETNSVTLSTEPNVPDQQNNITTFCDTIEDICGKTEMPDNFEDADGSSIPLTDIKFLVNEIVSARSKKFLHLIPVDTLVRLVNVLDHQIQYGQGLSIAENEYRDLDAGSIILSALESTHAVLAVMTYQDMPKQIYREEVIERIIDFTRYQIMDTMAAFNPSTRTPVKTSENGDFDGDEEDGDINTNSVDRRRRNIRSSTMRKSVGNKVSSALRSVIQKLCSVLAFLKDLLSVERLSDSCILQLVKTSFSTFLVESIQLLQLKSIDLICGVYASYAQHRDFLIDETVQLLRKLQFSKRTLRAYHLPDEEHKQIQMVSALLIQLVQCSTNVPEILKVPVTLNTILDAPIDASYLMKSHDAAKDACCNFWTSVLQRFTSVKSHEVSECKVILENLVNDLLITLNLPEYPASALILEVLCVLLLQNAGPTSKDLSARSVAIDLLGTIAARLKHEAAICSRDKFWILHELVNKCSEMGEAKDACSVCFKGKGLNIVCSVCQRCFHADCMGKSGQEMLRRDWSCHLCACKKQLSSLLSYCNIHRSNDGKKTACLSGNSGNTDPINQMEVVQQILLNYLNETGTQDDSNLFTCWFYICLWFKDVPQSQDKIIYSLARIKAKEILRDAGSGFSLPRDWAKKICLALAQHSSFFRGFDTILNLLSGSLKENSSVLRAKALRAVSLIVEADPEVLCDIRVQSGVEERFCDSAISVREAALELVGRHIASHPDVGLKYFEKVSDRIIDTGVSVRKRSIKIIRDLCISGQSFPQGTSAFIKIISRVTDDESSIRDLVCKTFYELWFEEPSESQTQFAGDGSSVPMEVATKTEQMVDVLRKMPSQNLFVTIIKRNLALDFLPQSAKASGISTLSLALVRKRCELICRRLLERILQVEERNSNEEEVRALPYVLALHAFCLVDPMLCTPATDPSKFVVTLQPYLKHQVNDRSIAQLLESIIFVVDAVLPLLRKPPLSVIEELQQDLTNMIMRHSYMSVVHASIRCLCSLGKIADKGTKQVENLLLLFFKKLDTLGYDNLQLVGRSLFCLGKILRYGNKLMGAGNPQHAHIVKSLSVLKKFLLMEDFSIKVRALQALGHVLIAKPEYMLDKDIRRIIEASLSSSTDPRLKMQVLQNIYEYLVDAESQLDSDGEAKTETEYPENNGNVPVAAGAGDTNICGGIIQLYWESILERCLDENDQVRTTTLKIVEIVLRQGLVHPITCVPCLVALETDPLEVNTKLAHHLLINMNEKYPAFFESRLGDGLQLAFRFYQSVVQNRPSENSKGKSDGNAITYVRPGITRIYRLIRGNRNSRNKFMHSIVRKFESSIWNRSPVPFLVYCAEMLATIPFTIPDEPLYLIYDINRVIQRRAGGLEANMKIWSLLPLQEDSAGISEELKKFQADCHDSIALQLLLKLKRHLKIVYGLDDSRCQAFSLKEHPKPGETLSRQSIPFNLSDIPTSLPNSYQDMLQNYQEFKAMLKDDTMDYATYTAEIKRKRPTPTPKSLKVPKTAAPSRARSHANKHDEDDDDDEDDDETWTGGARRLDFSDQKVAGGRVTRQRLRVT